MSELMPEVEATMALVRELSGKLDRVNERLDILESCVAEHWHCIQQIESRLRSTAIRKGD